MKEKNYISTYYGYKTKVLTLEGTADELFKLKIKKDYEEDLTINPNYKK